MNTVNMIYTNIGALFVPLICQTLYIFDILKKDFGGRKEDLKERERERKKYAEGRMNLGIFRGQDNDS